MENASHEENERQKKKSAKKDKKSKKEKTPSEISAAIPSTTISKPPESSSPKSMDVVDLLSFDSSASSPISEDAEFDAFFSEAPTQEPTQEPTQGPGQDSLAVFPQVSSLPFGAAFNGLSGPKSRGSNDIMAMFDTPHIQPVSSDPFTSIFAPRVAPKPRAEPRAEPRAVPPPPMPYTVFPMFSSIDPVLSSIPSPTPAMPYVGYCGQGIGVGFPSTKKVSSTSDVMALF